MSPIMKSCRSGAALPHAGAQGCHVDTAFEDGARGDRGVGGGSGLGCLRSGGGSVGESDSSVSARVPDTSSTSSSTSASTSSLPPVDTTTSLAGDQVTIAVSGWVGKDARGTVLCPYEFTEACPGIPASGGDLPPVGNPVRVTGRYDGVSLQVETVGSWTPYVRAELFNPCTGGSRPGSGGQSPEIESKVSDALAGNESRLAGRWLADGQLVVALTGPDDELAERIRAAHHRVCVDTGYPSSQEEIETLANDISQTLILDEGVWILDSWDSVVDGPIRIRVEGVDTPTVKTLARPVWRRSRSDHLHRGPRRSFGGSPRAAAIGPGRPPNPKRRNPGWCCHGGIGCRCGVDPRCRG